MLSIIEVIRERELLNDTLSPAQATALKVLYGLALTNEELTIYQQATGNATYSPREYRECMMICGRRSGKSSRIAANCAIYEACFRPHELAVGEQGHVIVLAATMRQAKVAFGYILGRLEHSPTLRRMIAGDPRQEEIELTNGITISVHACSYRSIRGISVVCAVADELAFWYDDVSAANPAAEVLRAIRPGMANFPNAKLIKISSPFAKEGVVWADWKNRAEHSEMLTWKLGTRLMNPSLDPKFLDAEQRRDPESFEREYGAEFYESASMFLSAEAVEGCVQCGRFELPADPGLRYYGSLDSAFRGDHFGWCVVHRVEDRVIVDVIRSKRGSRTNPVNLSSTLSEIVATLKAYGVGKIYGDSFCAEPIRQALKAEGIEFEQCTTLGSRAAPLWGTLRALIAERKIELLDDEETTSQLKKLQLVATHSGNQRIEAQEGHDDKSVCLALASHMAIAQHVQNVPWIECLRVDVVENERLWTRIY